MGTRNQLDCDCHQSIPSCAEFLSPHQKLKDAIQLVKIEVFTIQTSKAVEFQDQRPRVFVQQPKVVKMNFRKLSVVLLKS